MGEQTIEIEADTLEEARKKLYTDDRTVLQATVLYREKAGICKGIADTIEEALIKAKSKVPLMADIVDEKKIDPRRLALRVAENDLGSVGNGEYEEKESQSLYKKGRKGFLGIGKKTNVYDVIIFQKAVVEVKFRRRAKIQAIVKSYLARDLLQLVQELRMRDALVEEILQLLNPKNDSQVQIFLVGLLDLNLFDKHTALTIIESECRKDENANWQTAIEEAYKGTSDARMLLWVELRGLDAEIASAYMFYTSIDWYPKNYKEPTGIPMDTRISYGRHPPDNTKRQTIPHYSTDKKAFVELEKRAKEFSVHDFYKQILHKAGQDEATATLKQKCAAILKAQESHDEREV